MDCASMDSDVAIEGVIGEHDVLTSSILDEDGALWCIIISKSLLLLYWVHIAQIVDGMLEQDRFIHHQLQVSACLLAQDFIRLGPEAAE